MASEDPVDTDYKVVVGVDGSPASAEALRWAAREAAARHKPLRAVMAWDLLNQPRVDGESTFDPQFNQDKARSTVEQLVGEALGPEALAGVELHVPCDLPARALLDSAAARDLIVVGSRGLGGFKGLLLGSVSERVVHHATGPVVVVPFDRPQQRGQIVVGVDGSEPSIAALTWAIDEARRWDASVLAVAVLSLTYEAELPFVSMTALGDIESARSCLDDEVRRAGGDGEVLVERHVSYGQAAGVLRKLADDGALLVVGSRGLGGFPSLLLGSVSSQCVRHAPCPTVVVRAA